MGLSEHQLNETDLLILEVLREGRVTPLLASKLIEEKDVGHPYVQQRLSRMEEHDHLENIEGTGVYELLDDPVEEESEAEDDSEEDNDG